jgi:hypothetical protein
MKYRQMRLLTAFPARYDGHRAPSPLLHMPSLSCSLAPTTCAASVWISGQGGEAVALWVPGLVSARRHSRAPPLLAH